MIAILDYGAGNLHSVKKALDFIGAESRVVSSPEDFDRVDRMIFPGVGAFGAAIKKIKTCGLFPVVVDWIKEDRPFLGICLGMQLLMESSSESESSMGFDLFKGRCERFQKGKVPQIGWNQVEQKKRSKLLRDIKDDTYFYFVHSYYVKPADSRIVSATTDYFGAYASIIEKGNIHAVQFHPEKSGKPGLKLLENWVKRC